MICPECSGASRVTDSRLSPRDRGIKFKKCVQLLEMGDAVLTGDIPPYRIREHECKECAFTFLTIELMVDYVDEACWLRKTKECRKAGGKGHG